jgi:hypothetical protein
MDALLTASSAVKSDCDSLAVGGDGVCSVHRQLQHRQNCSMQNIATRDDLAGRDSVDGTFGG